MGEMLIVLFSFLCLINLVNANRHYEIWCVGNCDIDVTDAKTDPGVVLMGGGVSFQILDVYCC